MDFGEKVLQALPVVGSLGSSIYNAFNQSNENAKNRQFQHDEAALAYQRQVELWNMQNKYNSPAAQMARYADAGLNPNLIYSQQQQGATPPSVPQASSSASSISSVDNPFSGVFTNYMQAKSFDLNNRLINSEVQSNVSRALAEDERRRGYQIENARNEIRLNIEDSTKDIQKILVELGVPEKEAAIEAAKAASRLSIARNKALDYQNEFARRTMENRVMETSLGLEALKSELRFLNSKTKLTDEERNRVTLIKHQLMDEEFQRRYVWPDEYTRGAGVRLSSGQYDPRRDFENIFNSDDDVDLSSAGALLGFVLGRSGKTSKFRKAIGNSPDWADYYSRYN